MVDYIDLSTITFEDLQDEYQNLKERYSQLVFVNEQDTQRIHELRRSLATATAAEAYLVQELEQLSSVQTSQDDAIIQKKQLEIDELKKRHSAVLTENEDLQQDCADLRSENERLQQQIKELTLAYRPAEVSYRIPVEHLEIREKLEAENLELLAKLDETHESVVRFTMSLAEKEKNIEILKDQVLCLEENLQSKREEIDEKSHLLESTQEQIGEMNAKIALLTSSPDNADRKGNSLFAEVDDQRQAMKQLLATQKKNYLQMRKIYNESQHEIRRLKRENVAMHSELKACSTIFCSADKIYKEKLNERILQLLKQNEDLEKKLLISEKELISLANDKGVAWLDSMLLFCKQETDELKKELRSNRIQKGLLEERLRNSQQDLAKWRFEALKARCIIIDREGLLTDNNIEFKAFTNKDVTFSQNVIETAKPNIGFGSNVHKNEPECETVIAKVIKTEDKMTQPEDLHQKHIEARSFGVEIESPQLTKSTDTKEEKCDLQFEEKEDQHRIEETNSIIKTESLTPTLKPEVVELKTKSVEQVNKNLICKLEPDEENKENFSASSFEAGNIPKHCAKLEQSYISTESELMTKPSILVTKRNVLDDKSNLKTVHFETSAKSEQSGSKFVYKSTRTKSNIIVRRIVVGSRVKSEPGAPLNPQQ